MALKSSGRSAQSARASGATKPNAGRAPRPKRPVAGSKPKRSTAASPAAVLAREDTAAAPKLVRDSYTIPKSEYAALEQLKMRAANLRRPTKKSELLRAGIVALLAMNDGSFLTVLAKVPSLKTGRPKNRSPGK
jgi:hypothetical protein